MYSYARNYEYMHCGCVKTLCVDDDFSTLTQVVEYLFR